MLEYYQLSTMLNLLQFNLIRLKFDSNINIDKIFEYVAESNLFINITKLLDFNKN